MIWYLILSIGLARPVWIATANMQLVMYVTDSEAKRLTSQADESPTFRSFWVRVWDKKG